MPTLEELLRYKQPEAIDKMQDVAVSSFADKFAKNPTPLTAEQIDALNNIPEILNRYNSTRPNPSNASSVPEVPVQKAPVPEVSGLGVPVGESKTLSTDPEELKRQFAVLKNRGEMVGEPTEKSPSKEQLKHMFKGGDKPSTGASLAEDLDDSVLNSMNKTSKPMAAAVEAAPAEETGMAGLMSKLSGMPEEALAKLGPLGQSILKSRAMGLASKAASSPLGKFAGQVGLPIASSAFEAVNAKDSLAKGDIAGTAMHGAGALAGPAMIAEAAAAGPLAAASGGYAAGNLYRDVAGMGGDLPPTPPSDPNAPPSVPPIGPGGIMPPGQIGPTLANQGAPQEPPKEAPAPAPIARSMAGATSPMPEASRAPAEAQPNLIMPESTSENSVAALRAAQDQANQTKDRNASFRNLNNFATALVGGHNAVIKPNNEAFDLSDKSADEKITQLKERQAKELDDPASDASKKAVIFGSQILKQAGFDPNLVKGMSYTQIEKNFPQITKMLDTKMATDARKDVAHENALNRQAMLKIHSDDKKNAEYDKAMARTQAMMEQMRGNPAVQQAETTIANAQKLKSLLAEDPNGLNPQMTQLALMEVAKMATGGQPTEHDKQLLASGSYQELLSRAWQKVSNKPMPANQGEFLKQFANYAGALEKDAQKTIKDRYGRVLNPNISHLRPQDVESLDANYIRRFDNADTSGQDKEVQSYADQYFNGDYKKAQAYLKHSGQI